MKNGAFSTTRLVSLCIALWALAGSSNVLAGTREEFMPVLPEGKEWNLTWSDEFNGTKIDQSKWEILGDWKRRDGYWVKEDAYTDGEGHLILRTKKDGDRYTCGAIRTKNKFEHRFGYWVCRCKLPQQQGHWRHSGCTQMVSANLETRAETGQKSTLWNIPGATSA